MISWHYEVQQHHQTHAYGLVMQKSEADADEYAENIDLIISVFFK